MNIAIHQPIVKHIYFNDDQLLSDGTEIVHRICVHVRDRDGGLIGIWFKTQITLLEFVETLLELAKQKPPPGQYLRFPAEKGGAPLTSQNTDSEPLAA